MRLYEGTIASFNADVIENRIADQVGSNFERYYRRRVNPSEYRSWQQSFNFLRNCFEFSSLSDNKLIIEFELPYSTRRIDVFIPGEDWRKKWPREYHSRATAKPQSTPLRETDLIQTVNSTIRSRGPVA